MATFGDDYESSSDEGNDGNDIIDIGGGFTAEDDPNMDEETDYTVPPINMYNAEGGGAEDSDMEGGVGDDTADMDDEAPPNADIENDGENGGDNDDEDEDEDMVKLSEKYKKLKNSSHMEVLKAAHPESIAINYHEIEALTTIVYDDRKNIIDPLHMTIPILDKYEKTRIIGLRANQLDHGAKPFINIDAKVINSILIAEEELKQKKLPFIIKRPLPNGGAEYWKLADLEDVKML